MSPSRVTHTHIGEALAECQECDWHATERNALGIAAQHHDRTGHEVRAEITRIVRYGKAPTPEELGQTVLADTGRPA